MLKNVIKTAAVGALFMGAATMEAQAFPATAQTGETVGLARGAPLPEGVYFVNTLSWGSRNTPGENTRVLVDVPVIAWSTPWTILGANFQLLGALPNAHIDAPGGAADNYGLYNPFAAAALAWDLGNGFGVSYLSGIYFNAGDKDIRVGATTWRQDFAISYTGDGWNLTANLLWGITFDTSNYTGRNSTANGFNLDLTATKTFGKWELGLAAYGSTEYDTEGSRPKQKQFALGPLVGYNFGPVILQAYLTRDIYQRNLGGHETRLWTRVIIPLWTPTAAAAPLVTKY
ncbi:MAG: transporter [Hansschlegelia sp.]|jgi:hypothetical protein